MGEAQAVDEVMQNVALAAVAQRSPLLNPGRVAAWLYRLAVRHVLIYRRKTGRQRSLVDRYAAHKAASEVEAAPSPLAWLVNDERQQLVQAALRRLAPRDAELLILKYAEGYGAPVSWQGGWAPMLRPSRRVCIAHAIDSAQNWPSWPRNMRHPKMTKPDANEEIDHRLIDQIVDGDLTPAELRAAIERLDRQPDGWRRCAMAFLEAQCISETFRSLQPAASSSPALRAISSATVARTGAGHRWIRSPIAAAILAASFALGWLGHAVRPWSGARQTNMAQAMANPGPPGDGSRRSVTSEMVSTSAKRRLSSRSDRRDRGPCRR